MSFGSPPQDGFYSATLQKSKLYDASFGHRFRHGSASPAAQAAEKAHGYPAYPDTASLGQAPEGVTTNRSTPPQGVAPGTEDQA